MVVADNGGCSGVGVGVKAMQSHNVKTSAEFLRKAVGESLKVFNLLFLCGIHKLVGNTLLIYNLNGLDGLCHDGSIAGGLIAALAYNCEMISETESENVLAAERNGFRSGHLNEGRMTLYLIEKSLFEFYREKGTFCKYCHNL